ncbi:hypothetical protein D3C72_2109660 [compost metagenome]
MVQVGTVEIQAQAPTVDVDFSADTPQRTNAQGGITQLLANLTGAQGWHRFPLSRCMA